MWVARVVAAEAVVARSLSPGGRGDSSSTATVPATEASHHPASREGIMSTVPGVAAGSTYATRAAVTPEAAAGPATPEKITMKAAGRVTRAASTGLEPTTV